MGPLYPLHEEVVKHYCGYPVCIIMNDGSRHVGILSACGSGNVMLNAGPGEAEAMINQIQPKVSKKKKEGNSKKTEVHKSGKAQAMTQAYPYDSNYYGPQYYNPWGGPLILSLALIAFLFLLL